ncbi:hypothetical protein C8R45DRAFT_1019052 [Mycena sanguinolenta]|nr:hypothetical protein C8R45DRAFT_1019052 [Mycena sanguinolenta]
MLAGPRLVSRGWKSNLLSLARNPRIGRRREHTESTEAHVQNGFQWYPSLTASWHRISTLDARKLRPEDHVTFSERPEIIYFDGIYPNVKVRYQHKRDFPEGTAGFLYYWSRGTPLSPISDSVRLRLTPSLQTFAQGEDLLLSNGLPWQIMTSHIAYDGDRPHSTKTSYLGLCRKLVQDKLLSHRDLDYIQRRHKHREDYPSSQTLFGIDDPFSLERGKPVSLVMVGSSGAMLFRVSLPGLPGPETGVWPFGQTIARFEEFTHPRGLTVVLRILRIVDAMPRVTQKYNGPLCIPVEGKLLQFKHPLDGSPRAWKFTPNEGSVNQRALKAAGKRFGDGEDDNDFFSARM